MMLSFSEARQFHACQRKWFFKNALANALAKDPKRREAFLLSKLQSLSAWRGMIVDTILSRHVLPQLRSGHEISIDYVLRAAQRLFEEQSQFALAHRIREPGINISAHKSDFAAFFDIEYGKSVERSALDGAWSDIEQALRNALRMNDLMASLKSAYLVVQPRLFLDLGSVKVSANPDAIAFGRDSSIRIVDWKVHSFGLRAAKAQLSLYAAVLHRGAPPSYFPWNSTKTPLEQYVLCEVQLLNNEIHQYSITDDDIDDVIDDIFFTAEKIELACGDGSPTDMRPEEFPVTPWSESCKRCSFQRICIGCST